MSVKDAAVDQGDETVDDKDAHTQGVRLRIRAAAVLVMVLAAGTLAACGTTPAGGSAASSDTPGTTAGTSSGTPSASPVGASTSNRLRPVVARIDPAKLPTTASAVVTALGKLPTTLNGHPVTERTRKSVRYADGTALEAQPLVEAAGQGMTMAQFWPRLEAGHPGDFTVTSHGKPGEPLLWLTADGQAPSYRAFVAGMASPTGSWVFGVEAPSEKAAKDLLTAFAAALS